MKWKTGILRKQKKKTKKRKLDFANGATMTEDAGDEAAEKLNLDEWAKVRRQAELDILMDGYAAGSSSVARVAGRASLLEGIFLDMQCLGIDVRKLSAWDAALWVRSRVNSGKRRQAPTPKRRWCWRRSAPTRNSSRARPW